jgi:hypothetical protein
VGIHELMNGWVIMRRYTKHVSTCFLDDESGKRRLNLFILGRAED